MRVAIALLLSLTLIAGTAIYLNFTRRIQRQPPQMQRSLADAEFEIEIERTFDAVADPLAELDALTVTLAGETLYRSTANLARDELVRFEIDAAVETGINEINVLANRDFLDTGLGAMVVTTYRNDVPLQRQPIVSQPDLATIQGTVLFAGNPTEEVSRAERD